MISAAQKALMQKEIDSLEPDFKTRVLSWLRDMTAAGVEVYIYEGHRTADEQNVLYLKGRTQPGKIVTNARAWQSFHQYRLAIDWVPIINNVIGWDSKDLNAVETAYTLGRTLGKKYNFRAITWEEPHLEDARFTTWHELYDKQFPKEEKPKEVKEKVKVIDPRIRSKTLFDKFYAARH